MFRKLISLAATIAAMGTLAATPKPAILCTDIASDIDDTWALAQIVRSPELNLKMVVTETGEAAYRAAVAAKFLQTVGRADVEVALGLDFGVMAEKDRNQGPWIKGYDLDSYPGEVHRDGVSALIEYIRSADGPVTLIEIGPVPTLAAAILQAPDIAEKCDFYGMHGSFDVGYGGDPNPAAEYNVKADPEAFRAVMGARWRSVTLTPLDTCGLVDLDGANYHAIWSATGDPITRSLIENYCIWAPRVSWMNCNFFASRSSTLFDDVAVFMACSDAFIDYETIRFSVTDDGYTRRDPDGPFEAKVAIRWNDLPGFKRHLTRRILGQE